MLIFFQYIGDILIILKYSYSKNLKEILKNMAISYSGHGLPNIFKAETTFFKIMWSFFYITALISFFVLMIKNIINYNEFDIVTNIKSHPSFPMEFPAVTICTNHTKFNSSNSLF